MEGLLHAIALIAVIAGTFAACRRYGAFPTRVYSAFVIALAFLPLTVQLILLLCAPRCHGVLVLLSHQLTILAICLGVLLYAIPLSLAKRALLVAAFILLAVMCSLHFYRMVSLPQYALAGAPVLLDPAHGAAWHSWMTGVRELPRPLGFWELICGVPSGCAVADTAQRQWPPAWLCRPAVQAYLGWCGLLLLLGLTVAAVRRHHRRLRLQWPRRCWQSAALLTLFGLTFLPQASQPWSWPLATAGLCCSLLLGAIPARPRAKTAYAIISVTIALTLVM